ncbi:MAG: hypothetical protein M0Z48_07990 [Nitrospiraceae bacterium]|nr:hypothetical protein [Nitrospiraceae bacterium]
MILMASVLLMASRSFANPWDPGSGNLGVTLLVGYDASYFNLSTDNPSATVASGTMNGFYGELRGETEDYWSRLRADYSTGSPAFSEAAPLLNPNLIGSSSQKILNVEGDLGAKALDSDRPLPATLTLYVGLGYRDWKNGFPMGTIDFSSFYIPLGFNYIGRLKRLTFGIDGSLQVPFFTSTKLSESNGEPETSTSDINPDLGYRVELPITYDVYKSDNAFWMEPRQTKILLFLTPYWQYWKIPAWKITYLDGTFADSPAYITNTFGVLVGVGVNLDM